MVSLLLVLVVPQGGDLAAHLYRTLLVHHAILVWDNLWFAGQYPLFSYSLVYYPVASVVSNTPLGVASVVVSAALFASLTIREWGVVARWPARAFAVISTGQLFTGAYPFNAGVASLLATLWALQRGRVALALGFTALTFGFSPLAFVFLALALTALFFRRRRVTRRVVAVAAVVVAVASVEVGLSTLFPTSGLVYPFGLWRLVAGLAVAGSGAALALRTEQARTLALFFVVWATASLAAYAVPSAVGHNVLRASTFVSAHPAPGFRLEVVPTSNHWEAYYLPRAGYALARGWYRQLDIADNPALYRPRLTPSAYRRWLRQEAVRYVLLPSGPLEAIDAGREAALLRSGKSGLREVWRGRPGSIYALARADPILTGPGRTTITTFTSSTIAGHVSKAGSISFGSTTRRTGSPPPGTLRRARGS